MLWKAEKKQEIAVKKQEGRVGRKMVMFLGGRGARRKHKSERELVVSG